MTIHRDLANSELHEPKDVSSAAKATCYLADGAGSGAFAVPTGANTVIINVLADLPTPSGGTHTLLGATNYVFNAAINLGTNNLTLADGTNVTANNFYAYLTTYTGTNPMFVGVDANVNIHDMRIDCPNSDCFNISDSGAGGVFAAVVTDIIALRSKGVGTLNKLLAFKLDTLSFLNCTTGVTILGGVTESIALNTLAFLGTSTVFTGIDLTGTTNIKVFSLDTFLFIAGAGSIGIKGDAASANMFPGSVATVSNGQLAIVVTALSGITVDDFRWNFDNNAGVQDTMPDAMVSLTANATVTTLSVGVPTLVAGTWSLERASQYTTTTAGRATYIGERPLLTPIDASVVIDPASGTNKSFRVFIALNGTAIVNSGMSVNISNGDPKEISVPWQLVLAQNDFIEVFIENETDSVDATVADATLRLR